MALPPIPESFQNLEIEGDWSKSFKGENFLLHFDRDLGIAIFYTEYALHYLSRASLIFCDGNFSTAPSPFHQLFVIHALLGDFKIPIIFSLLSGKSETQYGIFLMGPKVIITDYETRLLICGMYTTGLEI